MKNKFVNVTYSVLPRPILEHQQNMAVYTRMLQAFDEVTVICCGETTGVDNLGKLTIVYFSRNPLVFIYLLIRFGMKNRGSQFNASDTTIAGLGLVLIKFLNRQTYTCELQGQLLNLDRKVVGFFSASLKRCLTLLTLRHAAKIRCVSDALAHEVSSSMSVHGQVHVLPPRVNLNDFKPRRNHNRTGVIGLPARLVIFKGVEYAIRAIATVDRSITLKIIGDGPLRDDLEGLAISLELKDRVEFVGEVPFSDMPNELALCDFVLLPSVDEGFGRVLIEAMALGIPCLGSDVGGIPNIIKPAKTGFLFEKKSPLAISNAITTAYDLSETLYEQMVENCISKSKEYDETRAFDKLMDFYSAN